MNKKELGRSSEKKAIKILKEDGYKLIEWTSEKRNSSYDFIVKKNNKIFYVEVRSRSGKNQQYFFFSKNKVKHLKSINGNVLIFLINENGYDYFNLKSLKDFVKKIQIGGNIIYPITSKYLYRESHDDEEIIELNRNAKYGIVYKRLQQVTGTCKGVTLTKAELELLENADVGDIVSVERARNEI